MRYAQLNEYSGGTITMQRFGGGNRNSGFRSGGGGFRGSDGPREMHKAVCADCKQDCEVPFKPTEGKPVYCKECYSKHRKF
jgi:CxxC-x17-CxxC domain-containing protein